MGKKGVLTKILAVIGTVLAWFPILATVVISVVVTISSGMFRFDYLIPAELSLVAIAGGGLLLWAALRARSRRGLIGWVLGAAVGLLVGGQALAEVTGLASGDIEPAGWPFVLVMASLVGYTLALIVLGVAGILLVRDLFQRDNKSSGPVINNGI